MKFLVVSDFHGKFPKGLKGVIRKEKIDMILSSGDYCGNERLGKLEFEYYYGYDKEVPKKIEKEVKRLEKKSTNDGINVVKELKKLNVDFLGVRGNWDPLPWFYDIGSSRKDNETRDSKRLIKFQTKSFRFIDFKLLDFKTFVFVCGTSSTYPGRIDKKSLRNANAKEKRKKLKEYAKRKKKYERIFMRAKKTKKPIIFLTHNSPYNTKLDKIKKGPAKGNHFGSFLEREMIRRFKPELVICGHMHENQGKDKLDGSVVVNSGSFMEKKFAIIDWDEEKGKVRKIKFVK